MYLRSQLGGRWDHVPSSWQVSRPCPFRWYPLSQENQHAIVYELLVQWGGWDEPCNGIGREGHVTAKEERKKEGERERKSKGRKVVIHIREGWKTKEKGNKIEVRQ